jgi:hypothetical protein
VSAPLPAELAALAEGIADVLAQREEALRDAREAAADSSNPPGVRAIYQAAERAWRVNVVALRADLACCRQGFNPYEIF